MRGTGNVFRDLGHENADAEQFKAILAAEIVKALDRNALQCARHMRGPALPRPTSLAFGMRNLSRFTADRLIGILNVSGRAWR